MRRKAIRKLTLSIRSKFGTVWFFFLVSFHSKPQLCLIRVNLKRPLTHPAAISANHFSTCVQNLSSFGRKMIFFWKWLHISFEIRKEKFLEVICTLFGDFHLRLFILHKYSSSDSHLNLDSNAIGSFPRISDVGYLKVSAARSVQQGDHSALRTELLFNPGKPGL